MDNSNYYKITDSSLLDTIALNFIKDLKNPISNAKVIVTIPAHNEEESIADCLQSIFNQKTFGHKTLSKFNFEVIVMCHNCDDDTRLKCQNFSNDNPDCNIIILETTNPEINNVGAVRRVLMNIAYRRLSDKRGFIAMTDADTIVDNYWIANLLCYIESDYGMICGKIEIDTSGLNDKMKQFLKLKDDYFSDVLKIEALFLNDIENPHPKHSDNSGPNLAIRGLVYSSIGGIKPIGFCEDVALYDEVLFNGYQVRHCPCTKVTTSSRTDARTPWGFGKELEKWDISKQIDFEVENLDGILARLAMNSLVNGLFKSKSSQGLENLKKLTGLDKDLDALLTNSNSKIAVGHQLLKKLEKNENWRKRFPKESIFEASKNLKRYLSSYDSSVVTI